VQMKTLKAALKKVLPRSAIDGARHILSYPRSRAFADPKKTESSIGAVTPEWRTRIIDTIECPDNAYIARVPEAGKLINGLVVTHSGIRVGGLGYYGAGTLNMLIENRGVHEPQEERAFGAVLPHVKAGSTMLELGAYWAYYSLWFAKTVKNSRCFLVEPLSEHLRSGEINFRINDAQGVFTQAFVDSFEGKDPEGRRCTAVDPFCARNGIEHLAILHADIQGAEVNMLRGAKLFLARKAVDWIFISTHSNQLHHDCIRILEASGYLIMASANLNETYSVDGLIVAKADAAIEPSTLEICKRRRVAPSNAITGPAPTV
jgi:Methyltransferase FkbM domain